MMFAHGGNALWMKAIVILISVSFCSHCKAPQSSIVKHTSHSANSERDDQYRRYLNDTLASLELMRGKTGLLKDSIWVCWDADLKKANFKNTEELTSPTNVGLDLLLLSQRITAGKDDGKAMATLAKVLQSLSTIAYHQSNGLFFRTYWPDTAEPADIHLSSIDNLHLAFGLWVAERALRDLNPEIAVIAHKLFERMDFSDFFHSETNLISGNLRPANENLSRHVKGDPQGPYQRDQFDYKYLGSETRSLYTLGWALGLYKSAARDIADFDERFLTDGIGSTVAEITRGSGKEDSRPLLRTWDGGGFQELLPGVLMREDLYSPLLEKLHQNYAQRLLRESELYGVPAARSASAFGVKGLRIFRTGDVSFDERLPVYNGTAGHVDLVATMHQDINDPRTRAYWDLAYTPHPAFMAAVFARDQESALKYAQIFRRNELIESPGSCRCRQHQIASEIMPAPTCECRSLLDLPNSKPGREGIIDEPNLCTVARDPNQSFGKDRLYQPGFGWMDGYFVDGPFKNRVIPVIISLDQSMIALSLYALLSTDGHNVGSRHLLSDPIVSARLATAYKAIDQKIISAFQGLESL